METTSKEKKKRGEPNNNVACGWFDEKYYHQRNQKGSEILKCLNKEKVQEEKRENVQSFLQKNEQWKVEFLKRGNGKEFTYDGFTFSISEFKL